jgi:hypothetical protein
LQAAHTALLPSAGDEFDAAAYEGRQGGSHAHCIVPDTQVRKKVGTDVEPTSAVYS